ncbi:MAG: type III pantothenate kinase [Bacteroidales bacterium]|nr:type III pantothenate kinase [Bacteroidales bacterium]
MKIVIDFGNTLKKIALFKEKKIVDIKSFKQINLKQLKSVIEEFETSLVSEDKIDAAIISSVINYPVSFKKYLKSKFKFTELSDKTPVPIINKYKTPETLGKDRLAAVVAANDYFPDENILVIDAGTCITYDFINSQNEYIGGGISPGISIRLQSLHNFTDNLPLLKSKDNVQLIGKTTEESILSGVLNGVLAEIQGVIELYKKEFFPVRIIFSGGDINYFVRKLKNDIFAIPNIVLNGLNVILDYNVKY